MVNYVVEHMVNHMVDHNFKVKLLWIPNRLKYSMSALLGALILLVASYARLSVCPHLLMSNSGATSKWNYNGFR